MTRADISDRVVGWTAVRTPEWREGTVGERRGHWGIVSVPTQQKGVRDTGDRGSPWAGMRGRREGWRPAAAP